MKRIFSVIALIITAICGIFCFTACDGASDKVFTHGDFYNDSVTIPIKFKKAYYSYFILKDDSNAMQYIKSGVDSIIEEGVTYETKVYGEDFLLIEKYLPNGNMCYYIVIRIGSERNGYFFNTPSTYFDGMKSNDTILFPYHLMGLSSELEDFWSYYGDGVGFGRIYRISGTKDEIIEFYDKMHVYDITENGDTVPIKLKGSQSDYNTCHTEKAFTITFGEDEEGKYAVYSYAEEQSE